MHMQCVTSTFDERTCNRVQGPVGTRLTTPGTQHEHPRLRWQPAERCHAVTPNHGIRIRQHRPAVALLMLPSSRRAMTAVGVVAKSWVLRQPAPPPPALPAVKAVMSRLKALCLFRAICCCQDDPSGWTAAAAVLRAEPASVQLSPPAAPTMLWQRSLRAAAAPPPQAMKLGAAAPARSMPLLVNVLVLTLLCTRCWRLVRLAIMSNSPRVVRLAATERPLKQPLAVIRTLQLVQRAAVASDTRPLPAANQQWTAALRCRASCAVGTPHTPAHGRHA